MNKTLNNAAQSQFNNAAKHFDEYNFLEREMAERLLEDLEYINIDPKVILDLGAGTGYGSMLLQKRFPNTTIIGLDFAINMLKQNKNPNLVCGDAREPPLKPHSFDMIFCNAMLHYCPDAAHVLKQIRTLLKPHGLFLFSMFGPRTLLDLQDACEARQKKSQTPTFLEMHEWVVLLGQHGFANPLLHRDGITLEYNDLEQLADDLKHTGKNWLSDADLAEVDKAYETARQENGALPAQFEIITGHAWGFSL